MNIIKMQSQQQASGVASGAPPRLLLADLNCHLVCVLCRGYLIDATTVVECLHSFCRSCLVRHLERVTACPTCDAPLPKARPFLHIRSDKTLQDIVYKLVPGLYHAEMQRRRQFFAQHPEHAALVNAEQRGESMEKLVFSPDDHFSLSLEYFDPQLEKDAPGLRTAEDWEIASSRSSESGHEGNVNAAEGTTSSAGPAKRYLQCPALFTVRLLKKFLRLKFELESNHRVDVIHRRVCLPDDYTLMDVAYIYSWRQSSPMRFFYRIYRDEDEIPRLPRKRPQAAAIPASEPIADESAAFSSGLPAPKRERTEEKETSESRVAPVSVSVPSSSAESISVESPAPPITTTPVPPPVSKTPTPPPVIKTPTPPPATKTPVPPFVSKTSVPPPVKTPVPPVSKTPVPPISKTSVPPPVSKTPTPPPVSKTPTPPPVSKTPTPPPVTKTPGPPPVSKTPVPPPVTKTPVPPPVSKTPVPTLVSKTPVPTLVSKTPVPTLVSKTPVPPPVIDTPAPPSSVQPTVPENISENIQMKEESSVLVCEMFASSQASSSEQQPPSESTTPAKSQPEEKTAEVSPPMPISPSKGSRPRSTGATRGGQSAPSILSIAQNLARKQQEQLQQQQTNANVEGNVTSHTPAPSLPPEVKDHKDTKFKPIQPKPQQAVTITVGDATVMQPHNEPAGYQQTLSQQPQKRPYSTKKASHANVYEKMKQQQVPGSESIKSQGKDLKDGAKKPKLQEEILRQTLSSKNRSPPKQQQLSSAARTRPSPTYVNSMSPFAPVHRPHPHPIRIPAPPKQQQRPSSLSSSSSPSPSPPADVVISPGAMGGGRGAHHTHLQGEQNRSGLFPNANGQSNVQAAAAAAAMLMQQQLELQSRFLHGHASSRPEWTHPALHPAHHPFLPPHADWLGSAESMKRLEGLMRSLGRSHNMFPYRPTMPNPAAAAAAAAAASAAHAQGSAAK